MIFSSSTFIVFFIALLAIYAGCRNHTQRAAVLLAGSIIFYASWRPAYLILLFSSLIFNYLVYKSLLKKPLKWVLISGIVIDLVVLAGFKYLALMIETGLWLLSWVEQSQSISAPDWIDWALPLGISFFTFQMLSALIDTYRGEWQYSITFSKWCLYVSFFPQLIAGPIVRAHELIVQLNDLKPIKMDHIKVGAAIFVGGLIKKVLFADNLGPIVDNLYARPEQLSLTLAWIASIAFAMQIYFDFSGYSEMALGLARIFGIVLPRNFCYPYISRNFTEFWRRWHITLSQWLRDYLYIAMGGNQRSTYRNYQNLMITMLLGGLWHGAGWTFVFWGFLHGSYLIFYRWLRIAFDVLRIEQGSVVDRILSWVGLPTTFILTCFTWVFFRAIMFPDAWQISGLMLGIVESGSPLVDIRLYEKLIVLAAFCLVFVEPFVVSFFNRRGLDWWWEFPFVLRGAVYTTLTLLILVLGGPTQKFVYFDF